MKTEKIKKWLPYIEADLEMAELGLIDKKVNKWTLLSVIWHCHQVAEKSLKMYIIASGKELVPVHDLPRLIKYSGLEMEKERVEFLYLLNKYYITPRYPDLPLTKSYTSASSKLAENYFNQSKEFFIWIKKIITEEKAS